MIMAYMNFMLPDYQSPMFGDSWMGEKAAKMKQYAGWSKVFPDNEAIRYFATDGKEGKHPSYLSKGLTTAGFYTFRNGWNTKSTVMVLKASPPGKVHAQPDNGTFELYIKGRNFMPDAGVFVYSGDAEIMQLRDWYRQTWIHNTLTLDNKNMVITKAQLNKWETSKHLDVLTYTNPSYEHMDHKRSVLFVDQQYFVIIDQAFGAARGNVGVHFQLKEDSKPVVDQKNNTIATTYADGNNLLLYSPSGTMKEELGKVSYAYRQESIRPAYVFEKQKSDAPVYFMSVLYPFEGNKAPAVTITENAGNDFANGKLNLTITINGVQKKIEVNIDL